MASWAPYYSGEVLDLRKSVIVASERPQLSTQLVTTAPPPTNFPNNNAIYQTPTASPSSSTTSSSPQYACYTTSAESFRPFKLVRPNPEYGVYRDTMFEAVKIRSGGSLVANPRMQRSVRSSLGNITDPGYQERRARNNAAAKRSRDLRKQKEDELAIRVAYLERQNAQLRRRLTLPIQCTRCHVIF